MQAQCMMVLKVSGQFTVVTSDLIMKTIGRTVRVAELKAEYSASSVDKDTSVCKNDFQIKGHGPRKMMYPVRDFADESDSEESIL